MTRNRNYSINLCGIKNTLCPKTQDIRRIKSPKPGEAAGDLVSQNKHFSL